MAPPGPSYNAGWNSSGPSSGFSAYDPHSIPSIFPLQLQDRFRNDLGFLNLTLPVLLNLPPLDSPSRIAAYPFRLLLGRRDPVYYPDHSVPHRFVGISSGISRQSFDDDFNALALNPQHFDQFVASLLLHFAGSGGSEETEVLGGSEFMDAAVGPFFQVPFYLGERFVREDTLWNSWTSFGATIDFSDIPSYSYRAEINLWEYAGSIRYNLRTGRLEPYVKGGYGWAWYRLENARAQGVTFTPGDSDWIGAGGPAERVALRPGAIAGAVETGRGPSRGTRPRSPGGAHPVHAGPRPGPLGDPAGGAALRLPDPGGRADGGARVAHRPPVGLHDQLLRAPGQAANPTTASGGPRAPASESPDRVGSFEARRCRATRFSVPFHHRPSHDRSAPRDPP
ncbi:MAG: hypothetical protein PVI57_05815 [Gemmatimonadota bacterium]